MARRQLAFVVRSALVDEQLLAAARKHQHSGTLAEAEARPGLGAVTLDEILGQSGDGAKRHFGAKTRLFSRFVYQLFVAGTGAIAAVAHPSGFATKSVLLADVYEPPIPWGGTAYLSVWAEPKGQPVLVPFPRVPPVLLETIPGTSFADSCNAYRDLVGDAVARVNLVAPVAAFIAKSREEAPADGPDHPTYR